MQSRLYDSLESIRDIFSQLGIKYCLVGGMAVSIRASERTTKDIDFAISVSLDSEAEILIRSLHSKGFRSSTLIENVRAKRISTVRMMRSKGPQFYIDLIFCACGIEQEVVQASTEVEILPNIFMPVATSSSLIAMKLVSVDNQSRPTDSADLKSLLLNASDLEIKEARSLSALIHERGFNRGRDLVHNLNQILLQIKK